MRFLWLLLLFFLLLASSAQAGPNSANYELREYGFGGGGTDQSTSTTYSLFGVAGEVESGKNSSTNYTVGEGLSFTMQANVPPAPAFTNPDTYYNKLKIVVNTGTNPSDAKFAMAISADNFGADTRYIQNDQTVGSTLGLEDWQTSTNWGGASGFLVVGLNAGTTYTIKVAAKRGNFTETGFGPTVQAATVNPTLTFDIDVASTDTDTSPPFAVDLGSLTASTVMTASNKVWVDVDTNGSSGAAVYLYGTYGGLNSSRTSYTISALSSNLATATEGYGARGTSVTQGSGGPVQFVSPYNGSGDTVGIVDTAKRVIFDSSGQAVSAGRAAFELKAKATSVTPAASDYGDVLTLIASATF